MVIISLKHGGLGFWLHYADLDWTQMSSCVRKKTNYLTRLNE